MINMSNVISVGPLIIENCIENTHPTLNNCKQNNRLIMDFFCYYELINSYDNLLFYLYFLLQDNVGLSLQDRDKNLLKLGIIVIQINYSNKNNNNYKNNDNNNNNDNNSNAN